MKRTSITTSSNPIWTASFLSVANRRRDRTSHPPRRLLPLPEIPRAPLPLHASSSDLTPRHADGSPIHVPQYIRTSPENAPPFPRTPRSGSLTVPRLAPAPPISKPSPNVNGANHGTSPFGTPARYAANRNPIDEHIDPSPSPTPDDDRTNVPSPHTSPSTADVAPSDHKRDTNPCAPAQTPLP